MIDLHTHSVYSDGTYTPKEIIDEAKKLGLTAVALCDHNTVDGLPEFMEAAAGTDVEAVPGVEFSTDYKGRELHLLALCVKPEYFEHITRIMKEVHRKKEESNIRLVEKLVALGYSISYDELKAKTPSGHFNRAHVAAALTEKGYTASIKEAFTTLLDSKRGLYEEPERLKTLDMISEIKRMGALAVLAHPFLNLTEEEFRGFLSEATPLGLDGFEVYYTTYSEEQTETAKRIAAEYGLRAGGGSDFHGAIKPGIFLGTGKGNLRIEDEVLTLLKNRIK